METNLFKQPGKKGESSESLRLQLELLFGGFIPTPVSAHHNHTEIPYNIADKKVLFMGLRY